MKTPEPLNDRLAKVDDKINAACERCTLDPNRPHATSLMELHQKLVASQPDTQIADALAEGLARIGDATLEHFPGNIYWDFDYLGATIGSLQTSAEILRTVDLVVALFAGFGCQSVINFRYIHDFTYGYDWARWVRKERATRAQSGPFSWTFLKYLERRCRELVELIGQNDEKYHQLPTGVPRNPFRFGREPEQERRLLETLVKNNLVPVQAWRVDGSTFWDRPFTDLREQYAARLEITRQPR